MVYRSLLTVNQFHEILILKWFIFENDSSLHANVAHLQKHEFILKSIV